MIMSATQVKIKFLNLVKKIFLNVQPTGRKRRKNSLNFREKTPGTKR